MEQKPLDNYNFPKGLVILVGAGPGDPELLTIGAFKAIKSADVIVFDALVSEEILELIPNETEKIMAGKRGGGHSTKQEDISNLLVKLGKQNLRVVRLKGGDPFVFGRGGEEACRLAEENIPFRIVPGLTSGIAGPAYAGIPVTHRAVNANFAFITGHESTANTQDHNSDDVHPSRIDWEGVARTFPVIVLYMAMRNVESVRKRMVAAGRSPETPVALIRWATTPRQQTMVTTLGSVTRDIKAVGMKPPAIMIIGKVVNYREILQWFKDETLLPPES
ncbi:MAG: uroporphyrinogen-III C-methyltransferase [Magnetococcales bacterium]|nr:uroporphyrinogen-III C-methyltransferase [Magnetococcales bacterium]